jgi:hypothetical protein
MRDKERSRLTRLPQRSEKSAQVGEGITASAIGSWAKPQPPGETQDGSSGEGNHITDMLSLNQKPDLPGECSGDHRIDRGGSVWTCEAFDAGTPRNVSRLQPQPLPLPVVR